MSDGSSNQTPESNPCGCSGTQLERINAYLDGALTVEDLREISDHIEDCPDCTREHDLEQLIRSAVRRSCSETAPEALRSSIMARIREVCADPQTGASGRTSEADADAQQARAS